MSEEYARRLLHNAITLVKSGEPDSARKYLERLFMSSRDHDMLANGWFYMSEIATELTEKRKALEEALSYNMTHARARRALAVLDGRLNNDEVINPDAILAPSMNDLQGNAERFTCPNCGGRMSFAPDGQALVCEYCSSGGGIGSASETTEEQDFFTAMATLRGHRSPVARQVFHCDGCGAEFLLPPDTISAVCGYCASPHVVSLEKTRELLDPDAIIPHTFDKRRATQLLVEWVQENNFTPQGKVLPPRGFYLPVWTFDIIGTIGYNGQRYKEDDLGFQKKMVMKTERGDYPVYIDDFVIPASHEREEHVPRLIKTYDLRKAKPYDARYLSNWPAEAYEIALGDASLEARSQAYKEYKRKVEMDISYLTNIKTSSANLAIDSYKLLMLPIWMTTYPYEGKEQIVLINGQNGTVQGQIPNSKQAKPNGGILSWLDDLLEF